MPVGRDGEATSFFSRRRWRNEVASLNGCVARAGGALCRALGGGGGGGGFPRAAESSHVFGRETSPLKGRSRAINGVGEVWCEPKSD